MLGERPDLAPKPKAAELDFNKIVTDSVGIFLKDALRTVVAHPSQAAFFVRTLRWQRKAAKIRQKWEAAGVHVPPILIFSVTHQCNLHCDGCYHHALRQAPETELSDERLKKAVAEAKELGVSFIVFAGGEPLMKPSILDITREYPEILFLMFTNGLLLNNDDILKRIAEKRNVLPLVSLEGYQDDTDARRGRGVYAQVQKSIAKMKAKGIFLDLDGTIVDSKEAYIEAARIASKAIGKLPLRWPLFQVFTNFIVPVSITPTSPVACRFTYSLLLASSI